MGYRVTKVVMKPTLSEDKDFIVRLAYAKRWTRSQASWQRVVHIDEKWFTEEKPKRPQVEQRDGSPLKNKFTSHKKETQTQLNKLMYLAAVCKKGAVGIWLLDWSKYCKQNRGGGTISTTKKTCTCICIPVVFACEPLLTGPPFCTCIGHTKGHLGYQTWVCLVRLK